MDRQSGRQDQMAVQASPRRDLPRRLAVQRRCGGLERREGAEAGRTAVRREPGRRHRLAHADADVGAQDRRPHGRADDQGAGQLPADQPHQSVHGEPGQVAEALRDRRRRRRQGEVAGRLGHVRARRLRHRPVEDVEVHAARTARGGEERRLLGQGARAEGRQDGHAADAGGERAHRRPALRPGRLDRGAGARCGRRS